MSIEAKYFFQIKTDANRCRTVSKPPCTVNRTKASVPRYTVKRYIVSPLAVAIINDKEEATAMFPSIANAYEVRCEIAL